MPDAHFKIVRPQIVAPEGVHQHSEICVEEQEGKQIYSRS